jgi:hypothetical protein
VLNLYIMVDVEVDKPRASEGKFRKMGMNVMKKMNVVIMVDEETVEADVSRRDLHGTTIIGGEKGLLII